MIDTTHTVQALQHAADTLHAGGPAADTLHAAGAAAAHGGGTGGEKIFMDLLHHLQDSHEVELPFIHLSLPQFRPVELFGMTIDFSITKHVFFIWVAAFLLCVFLFAAARSNRRRRVPHGWGNFIEFLVVFVRDEIAIPNMGPGGVKYLPYLLTTFVFILIMNLLGLIPYGSSATGNVSVTAGLAIVAFVMIQWSAIRAQGLKRYLAHLTGGVHWLLWPIMVPIEILGLFTKPFALCIRLFANMMGGHTVLVSIIGLIFVFQSYIIAVAPAGFVVGIMFLELLVAVLQAYIFTMLTSLFMGIGMVSEEHGGGHSGHEHTGQKS